MRARVIRFKLADILAAREWSAYRLAQESGIPQPTVYRLLEDVEAKDARISLRTLNSLCNALSCKVSDLLEHAPDAPKRRKAK
jgi:Predicted transcriptional regulator